MPIVKLQMEVVRQQTALAWTNDLIPLPLRRKVTLVISNDGELN